MGPFAVDEISTNGLVELPAIFGVLAALAAGELLAAERDKVVGVLVEQFELDDVVLFVSVEHHPRRRVPDLHAALLRRHEVLSARRDERVRNVP